MNILALSPPLAILYSEAHILIEVDQVVQRIIDSHTNVFNADDIIFFADEVKSICQPGLSYDFLVQLIHNFPRYLSVYDPNYQYSECYSAFLYGCQKMTFNKSRLNGLYNYPETIAEIEALIKHILIYTHTNEFKRQISDRRYRLKENKKKLVDYCNAIHSAYAKVLVCRLDLHYYKQYSHCITIDKVTNDLRQLMKSRHGDKDRVSDDIFVHQLGHICRIEQGIDSGYHIHTGFYFHASYHQNGWYKANQIGERWKVITNEMGYIHNCHNDSASYKRQGKYGLDVVHRCDTQACINSLTAMSYLTQEKTPSQHLRKKPKNANAFTTGQWKS